MNIERALTTADTLQAFCKPLTELCDFLNTDPSMLLRMKKADTWKPIGDLSKRLAARLVTLREAQVFAGDRKPPAPQGTEGSVPTGGGWPGGKVETGMRAGQRDDARMDFSGPSPVREGEAPLPRAHSASPFSNKAGLTPNLRSTETAT